MDIYEDRKKQSWYSELEDFEEEMNEQLDFKRKEELINKMGQIDIYGNEIKQEDIENIEYLKSNIAKLKTKINNCKQKIEKHQKEVKRLEAIYERIDSRKL